MVKKRQILTLVSIATISFLGGAMFNMNFIATGGDSSPWNKVWQAIYDLQGEVQSLNQTIQSLNQTIEDLKTQIPKKPVVITVYDLSLRGLPYEQWTDIISISDVTVWEGANVFAIVTTDIYRSGVWWLRGIRHRANDVYGESHYTETSPVEVHHTWTNLSAGTYAFATQVFVDSNSNVYGVYNTRLTLIIT